MNIKYMRGRKPLIVCVTDTEYAAVKNHFSDGERETFQSVVLEHGFFGGHPFTLCRFAEMGSRGGDTIAQRMAEILEYLAPTFVVELGICFGLKDDVKIGDVAVCQYSADYELEKVNATSRQSRARTTKADSKLYAELIAFASRQTFKYQVVGAVYACGDKVVNSPGLKKRILRTIPDAKCGDMESYTLGVACDNKRIPWIVLKASSDDGVNKGDEFQKSAAAASVEFFNAFLVDWNNFQTYFDVPFEVDFKSGSEFDYISREIFNGAPLKAEVINTARTLAEIHYHPEIEDAWIIVYISRAHSVPETLRTVLKKFLPCPARIEVCIASDGTISETSLNGYMAVLTEAGCKKPFIAQIGDFIFTRIVEKRAFSLPIRPPVNYVDQILYRGEAQHTTGRRYADAFLAASGESKLSLKPISVVLGQGGVGKTTFCLGLVNLINEVNAYPKRVLLITKNDVVKGIGNDAICSISDLYNVYVRGLSGQNQVITQQGFKLALSSGSLVVIIDGIDEIESALAEKFDLAAFAESISKLNSSLHSCRVLVTSRDVNVRRLESLGNADIVYLKGFRETDIDIFLRQDEQTLKDNLRKLFQKIKNDTGFVNPYLLHVARQFLANGANKTPVAIETKKLSLTEPFDYILTRCIQREIEKQSLSISIDEYYDLLNEVVVEHYNQMDVANFENYISICLDHAFAGRTNARREPYLKFFLLEQHGETVSVCHQEYVAQILLNRAQAIFLDEGAISEGQLTSLESIFGEVKNESFGLKERLSQRLAAAEITHTRLQEKLRSLLLKLKALALTHRRQRTIFETYLFAFEFTRASSLEERKKILLDLNSSNNIEKLFILGDCPAIDFSGLVFTESVFRNYQHFFNGRFDDQTQFRKCEFSNCTARYKLSNVRQDMFRECTFDEGMKQLLAVGEDRRKDSVSRVKSDVKQVLRAMRQGLGFSATGYNRIKSHSNIVSELSYESFLRILVTCEVLQYTDDLYRVKASAEGDAIALCDEDHLQGVVLAAVQALQN